MIPSKEDFKLSVKKGMNWLVQERPDWIEKVNLEQLAMVDSCRCILGQVFHESNSFDAYYSVVDGNLGSDDRIHDEDWATEHGFCTGIDYWAPLEATWIEAVQERKA